MRYFMYCRKSSESEDRQILSIESQQNELRRAFSNDPSIEIVGAYDEAFSAKSPGRPLFDEMMTRIERGEAEGIVAWHPDRLARNSVDGGRIVWFLDRTLIKDLKFATYTFENNPQGKFMLSIFLGQSKYYVDALSENVKRGNRTKVEKGWRPNKAPLGYLNCPETRTIVIDPERFPLIRKMFDLMLIGAYSPAQIHEMANTEWGLRTVQRKVRGGKPVSLSGIYRILTNPFYAGVLVWNDQIHPGKQEPVVSLEEFEVVQKRLGRPHVARPKKKEFAYTGLIRCGACGLAVTAEEKTNRHGSHYIYYHCSRRNPAPHRCRQPSIQLTDLELQILLFLESIRLPEQQQKWLLTQIRNTKSSCIAHHELRLRSLEKAHAGITKSLDTLTDLRLRDMIGDDDFTRKRAELQQEQLRLRRRLDQGVADIGAFEPFTEFISFSNRAADWFRSGTPEIKRLILKTTGSNPILTDKILNVEARKPFTLFVDVFNISQLRAVVQDVRTLCDDPEFREMVASIRELQKQLEDSENRPDPRSMSVV